MDEGINIGDVDPQWMRDGYGITGDQGDPVDDDYTQWDTRAWSRDDQKEDFTGAVGGGFTVQTRDGGGFGTIIQQVTGVVTITYDSDVFLIQDNGGGEVVVYCA